MKRLFLVFLALTLAAHVGFRSPGAVWAEDDEPLKATIDAYIYAYPLVLMDVARLSVEKKTGIEDNMFFRGHGFLEADPSDAGARTVPFFGAWLNLSREPVIIHTPNFAGRAYSVQLTDGWNNVIASFAAPGTPKPAGDILVAGRSWYRALPSGMTVIKSPTDMALLFVRLLSPDAVEGTLAAYALQGQMSIAPLSSYEKRESGPMVLARPIPTEMKPPFEAVADMDGKTFFTCFARLLAVNPPSKADAAVMADLASMGIVPGPDFNFDGLDPMVQDRISRSISPAQMKIAAVLAHGEPDPGDLEPSYLAKARRAVNIALDASSVCQTVESPAVADRLTKPSGQADRLESEADIPHESGILVRTEGRRNSAIGFDIREDIKRGQEFLRDKTSGCSQIIEEKRIAFRDRKGRRKERLLLKRIIRPNFLLAVEDVKERKLRQVLISTRGCVTQGFHVTRLRDNGVASRFEISYPENMAILALRTTVHSGAHGFKEVVYTPYSPEIDTEQVRKSGLDYLMGRIRLAQEDLAEKRVNLDLLATGDSMPMEVSLVLSIIEHIDPERFQRYRGNEIALVHEVLTTIGANTTEAYSYSKSPAGARGLFQFIPATYKMLLGKYRRAGLNKDFVSGCFDHVNAAKASLLLFDADLASLPKKLLLSAPKDGRSVGMYLAASYNCGPRRVEKSALECKDHWTCRLPQETKVYLEKFEAVWNLRNVLDK